MSQSAAPQGPGPLPAVLAEVTVAVLGGTGPQGRGLARRFAAAGIPVVLGSRDAGRAAQAAAALAEALGERVGGSVGAGVDGGVGAGVTGSDNASAARTADVVVVAVPWDGHRELLSGLVQELAGKVVVDCVNPLGFDKQGAYPLTVEEGSAAQQAAALLPESTVVGAFHHVSAVLLEDPETTALDIDVLVVGDVRDATDLVQDLAAVLPGARGVYAGRLRNAGQVEALTANLISINRRYRAHSAVRVTDIG